jgi:hypothetical protein
VLTVWNEEGLTGLYLILAFYPGINQKGAGSYRRHAMPPIGDDVEGLGWVLA